MRYWLVALLTLAAIVAIVLIIYTWPRPPLRNAETRGAKNLAAAPEFVSAETRASVPTAVADDIADSAVTRVETTDEQPERWSGLQCRALDAGGERDECIGRTLAMHFDSEGRDPAWASATERIILDGLADVSTVTTVTALTVECRATVCRLQMGFPAIAYVPTQGPPERDLALVSNIFRPMLQRTDLRTLIAPYPRSVELPERTYYFAR